MHSNEFKPHGKSLKEGGDITGKEPNASFNQAIGTENDPGRVAENRFAGSHAQTAGSASSNNKAINVGYGGQYEGLKPNEHTD